MLPLVRLEGEPKFGAIFAYLFISATLKKKSRSHGREAGILIWRNHLSSMCDHNKDSMVFFCMLIYFSRKQTNNQDNLIKGWPLVKDLIQLDNVTMHVTVLR